MRSVFADPFWGRALIGVIIGIIAFAAWFFVDILQYVTRRDFKHIELQVVHFTRHDNAKKSNTIRFNTVDHMKLRPVLDNRFLYWALLWHAFCATKERPVLDLGRKGYAILSNIRREHMRRTANSEYKRAAGLPFVEPTFKMCIVYDLSEDKSHYVLRGTLMQVRDVAGFEQYMAKKHRPMNTQNYELAEKIWRAHSEGKGSFIDVRVTAA